MGIEGSDFLVLGIPLEFILFATTLLGVAVFHHRTLLVAAIGLVAIVAYKLALPGFDEGAGLPGFGGHLLGEWVVLANLGMLLTGFSILTRHFEQSSLPDLAPDALPAGWPGGLLLLFFIFIISAFLDNIAAALIGATIARHVYRDRVTIGFLAAIVAASNAGGAGSVVGDTTTTMMWIDGKSPLDVLHAYVGSVACFAVFAFPAAMSQEKHQPILKHDTGGFTLDWARLGIVLFILASAVTANVLSNALAPWLDGVFPVIGVAVWVAILIASRLRPTDWKVLRPAVKGAAFLLSLVLCASLMPVKDLPAASWGTTLSLGFISSVFDNIPLTALALGQGGYDWGVLAYAVGFGGSMVWFGSSAGVAVSNLFPHAKSVTNWLRRAWWLPPAYLVGFFVLIGIMGWRPHL